MKNNKLSRNIKIILKKCTNITTLKYKDKLNQEKEITIEDIIKDSMLKSCMACNKSSQMWSSYYFDVRFEAQSQFNNLSDEYKNKIIEKEYKKSVKKIKDKAKLENVKYMGKVRKTATSNANNNIMKSIEKEIMNNRTIADGKSYASVIQFYTKQIMQDYNTGNIGQLDRSLVQANWSRDKEDILNYKVLAPQYKSNTPYYLHNKNYIIRKTDNGFEVDISFLSLDGYKKYGLKKGEYFTFKVDKLGNSEKAILNRLISKDYSQGSAYIHFNRKGKIEMGISFSFEKKQEIKLDKNRVLGIDLGITNVATMSVYDSTEEEYDYFSWRRNVISGKELIAFRQKYYNLRRDLSIASKVAGSGRCGHGYKTKMKPVNQIRDKIARFSDTYNHKVSRYIVDFAIKNNCGTIQMEDLTNATAEAQNRMLKDWSYYDLQQKIEYKAQEYGIEVIKVNPKYTSKRCNKCGCIHLDNRDCKNNQAKFECKVCGHKENADVNASKNIAIPNIDKIIKETEIIK